jgi:hypothetical protein
MLLLTLLAAAALRRDLKLPGIAWLTALAVVILPAVVLTLVREGKTVDSELLQEYFVEFVAHRILTAPVEVGLWYMHHAQSVGPMGIGAIPKLAAILGVPPINAPNEIGLYYFETKLASVNANAGFLFSYYGYFGILSLWLSVCLLWLLDLALLVLRRVGDDLILPTTATMAVNALAFVQSDFTVALVTHGFAATLLAGAGLSWLSGRRALAYSAHQAARS